MAKRKKAKKTASNLPEAMKAKLTKAKKSQPKKDITGPVRMAVWGASPYVITGFGEVMRQILTNLYGNYPGSYEVYQVGINFVEHNYDEFAITGGPENGTYRQWSAYSPGPGADRRHIYGQRRFLELLKELLPKVDLDVIFIFEDPFILGGQVPGTQQPVAMIDAIKMILKQTGREHVPIVSYYPIDGQPKVEWLNNIAKTDFPITYLRFGKKTSEALCPALRGRVSVIPHGADLTEFKPVSKEEARIFKRAMFGERFADRFMFLNVNRNQLRKLIPSGLIAFREFKKQVPESFIYLNMKAVDVGWNLPEVCRSLGLKIGEDVLFPRDFNVQKGLTLEDLNKVFNCADVLLSTAIGGGWELAITQAFSTKTSVIAPANTSHVELCGPQGPEEARGLLYASGSNLSQYAIFPHDNEVPRPLPDLEDLVNKMVWAYQNQELCRAMEERAYEWVKTLNWSENIVPNFHRVFQAAAKKKRVATGQMVDDSSSIITEGQGAEASSNVFVGSV